MLGVTTESVSRWMKLHETLLSGILLGIIAFTLQVYPGDFSFGFQGQGCSRISVDATLWALINTCDSYMSDLSYVSHLRRSHFQFLLLICQIVYFSVVYLERLNQTSTATWKRQTPGHGGEPSNTWFSNFAWAINIF